MLAFTVDEYRSRLAQVQAAMSVRGLEALLLRRRAEICYLTGMENGYLTPYYAAIVPLSGEPILLASDFEMLNADVSSWCADRVAFPVAADPVAAACATLTERGLGRARIGLDLDAVSAAEHGRMRERLPAAAFIEAGGVLHPIMQVKSPAEIACLREAARLTTLGMEAALAEATVGKLDNDLAAAAAAAIIKGGSEFPCIDPIVTVGRRSGIPHTTFRRTTIHPGDAILIELGACVCRYTAPLMRCAVAGPLPEEVGRAAEACRESLEALLAAMHPGACARDVAAKAKAAWAPATREWIWHGIYAYSVGLGFPPDWNDVPLLITEDSEAVLAPGMCFHATTSLRRAGQFGVALSETVLITDRGPDVLTGTPRRLAVV